MLHVNYIYHVTCYIPSSYLSYNWNFLPFDHFHSILPLSFISGNHKSDTGFVLCIYNSVSVLFMFVHLFYFLDSIYKWNHMYFLPFHLVWTTSWFIHVVANGKILFFLWLSNIPLCVCTCVHVYMQTYTYIYTYTYYILYPFIYWLILRLLPYLSYCK